MPKDIKYIDSVMLVDKRILFRVDYNVSLSEDRTIADDERIVQSLPSIKRLYPKNKLILVSHLDRPRKRDPKLSLVVVVKRLQKYLPGVKISLVPDFLSKNKEIFEEQKNGEILVLENIRFYPGEENNDSEFAKHLASLADVYVNDAFAVCHRAAASVVGVPKLLPSYGGLLLKKEVEMIKKVIKNPKKPLVAIIGGAKISTKINLIGHLTEIADYVLLGGGLANVFFLAQGHNIGKSICEYELVEKARQLLFAASARQTAIVLPTDVLVGDAENREKGGEIRKVSEISDGEAILDIGPETKAQFGSIIARAKTIIWNGPVGYFENPLFKQGTDFIYYSIAHNPEAISIVGGGDTIAAISNKEYLGKITHISTGGGAMLEFIENGTLPGIKALE
ncbi:phosphoglycerate kinase [Patescibacteria group bacterium]|nr:phosphoglycerate kinase [Patescibacteria group bacterium]